MQNSKLSSTRTTSQPSGPFASAAVRSAILLVWLLLTVVAAYIAIAGFRIDNSVGVWFAADDPALTDYQRYLSDFGGREWILVAAERGASSREAQRSDWNELISRYQGLEHVHWVLSAADFRQQSNIVQRFLKPDPQSSREALLLHITNDIERQDGYRETLVAELRRIAEEFPTIASVQVAGTAVINGELNHAARRDMFLFFPAVALFVTLLGWIVFRNVRDTVVLLSVSLGTVVVTEGLLVGAGYPLNMVTIMLPTVLIALSVADVVHLIHAFHAESRGAGHRASAATRAVKSIAWPCAGTTLTTIAGFLAFSGSTVLPVFQLSIFASFGIAFAWILTMSGAPVLLVVLWQGRIRKEPPAALLGERLLGPWSRFVDGHPRWIVGAFVLGSAVLVGLPSLRADTDYVRFFRSTSRVPRDYETLQRAGFPQNPLNLVFQPPRGESPTTPRYWIPLEKFAHQLEALPGVHSVLSPFVMGDLARVRCEYAATLGGMLSERSDQVQLIVMMDYPSSQRLFMLLPEIRELADSVLPSELVMIPTGTSYLWARMDDGVIRTQKESLVIVSVVCFVILVFLFRSFGLGVLGLALSLYPVAMVLGLMGLLNVPVNIATVLIAGIAVGLAVDDTIHLVHAYQDLRRHGRDPRSACEAALVGVGVRMVVTSLILIGSFASMGFSNFLPTSQFGLLSSLTITLALLVDMTVLPVMLSRCRASTRRPLTDHRLVVSVESESTLSRRSAWVRQS